MLKKRIIMLTGAVTAAAMGAVLSVFPVSADSSFRSRGILTLEDEGLNFCAADMEYLHAEVDALTGEIPDTDNKAPYDVVKDAIRRKQIQSSGIIDYANGTVLLDASDLKYLADEIDTLETSYKMLTAQALNRIGTYFQPDASVTYEPEKAASPETYAGNLSFDKLYEGILQSQSVAHLAAKQALNGAGEALFFVDEEAENNRRLADITTAVNDHPLMIQAAAAENLSAGTAAWVNGKLIIGTGEDNRLHYNKGYENGGKDAIKHIYEGESFSTGYPDVCAAVFFTTDDPLWTEVSDNKNETYQIPLKDENGRMLYGISFQCRYRANQYLDNSVSASGSYTLSTKEGGVIESAATIEAVPYKTGDADFDHKEVYIDLFAKSFSTDDDFLYLQLQGSAYARYIAWNQYAQAYGDFHFVNIIAKYK